MEIFSYFEPFPYLKIKNYYTEKENELIWEELKFLTHKSKLEPPQKTGQNNPIMKKNEGVFLDNVYTDRHYSNILNINRKTFSSCIMKEYSNLHFLHEIVNNINSDTTLLSYYENKGYYKPHSDKACITALTWFYKEPKQFTGGDLIFSSFNEKIEIENNMFIMFPSIIKHEVTDIVMDKSLSDFSGNGRYCISQFMNIA
jgi:Rps23 Pro-64 3,4-dihydroxylase Tpa1-like proline 4-hydroxylase